MRITVRLIVLLVLITALCAGWVVYSRFAEQRQTELVLSTNVNSKNTGLDRILKLEGTPFEAFVYDFSGRDDMCAFVRQPEPAWADRYLKNMLPGANISAVWVYDRSFACVYAASVVAGQAQCEFSVPEPVLQRLLANRYFHHFFQQTACGVLEIRCAPIQPRTDTERSTQPQGFLFAGRLWTGDYLEELSGLTDSSIALRPISPDVPVSEPSYDFAGGTISFFRVLRAWDRSPIIELAVRSDLPVLREMARAGRSHFVQLLVFLALVLTLLSAALILWVQIPLRHLSRSLSERNPALLAGLERQRTEYGTFALLIADFFGQQQTLNAANARLLEANQQLKASQDDAQKANEFLENMLQGAFDGIIVSDEKGHIIRTNRALERMVGYSKEEITGKHMAELAPPEQPYIDIAGNMMFALRGQGFVENCETCFLRKDGSLCPVEFNVSYVKDAAGKITGAFSSIRDITERKKAEKEQKEAKQFLENILRATLDGLVVTDARGYVIQTNEALEKMLGYETGELLGKHMGELGPLDQPYVVIAQDMMFALREKGFVKNHETAWLRKDGSLCPVEFNIGYVKDEAGTILGAVGGVRDITQRKKAEHELKESRDFFQAVIEGSRDGIIITDEKGVIKLVNTAIEQLFGFSKDELNGMHASMLVVDDTEVRNKALSATAELFEKGYATYETTHKAKDGRLFEAECIVSMIRDEQGHNVGSVAMLRDVSERKRIEQHLRQSQKMEAIGTLAGGIAHDFNNILTAIIGYTEIAQIRVSEDTDVKNTLDQVLKAADRAKNLVKQILAFSRKSEHERKPISLHLVMHEALKLLRASLPATIDILQDIKKENDTVNADPTQIHQIIMNLCTNAAHAMQENGGVLEIGLASVELDEEEVNAYVDLQPGPYMQLMVRDTGTGIAPDIIDRIFDPFFTTKEVGKGTGMGLAVVHGIVKGYGGAIRVQSEPGQGSTFYVVLPRLLESPAAPGAAAGKQPPRGTERILFVDDEKTLNDMVTTLLKSLGYTVTAKQNSLEALEVFQQDPLQFDLVITDQTMPGMTGDILAKKILETRPETPIILCTGYSEKVSEETAKKLGIKAFVMKPVNRRDIAETIRSVLGQA